LRSSKKISKVSFLALNVLTRPTQKSQCSLYIDSDFVYCSNISVKTLFKLSHAPVTVEIYLKDNTKIIDQCNCSNHRCSIFKWNEGIEDDVRNQLLMKFEDLRNPDDLQSCKIRRPKLFGALVSSESLCGKLLSLI
jgi:hypothetical protein